MAKSYGTMAAGAHFPTHPGISVAPADVHACYVSWRTFYFWQLSKAQLSKEETSCLKGHSIYSVH